MARIELDRVDLTFQVRKYGRMPLKDMFLRLIRPAKENNPVIEVEALRGVSFKVEEGQRLGVIGRNGSGKSTLLKVLAGIYRPSSGERVVEGRVTSLFDIALGFEMDATGWDNILYRGYLQKESPRSMRAKRRAIAEFSELGEKLKMPVRYYSAGMLVRLAFSISTAIDPEILLVDEVLAAGDAAFQVKAKQRMNELINRARLIVLVSHDLGSLNSLCDRAIWLDGGTVRTEGPARAVTEQYLKELLAPPPAVAMAA
jgi:ABC-type polysaccharide/polyol phosphate transport system ATPase subunit